ncbi:MAG: C2H2-type zinc finger protein [Desulfurococcales archaeon]|nr:C2H2-type zinc finger protein [Desulfurococcales archaeon]
MAVKCPYCGRWFKNKRALKTHIRQAHPTEYYLFEAPLKTPKPPKLLSPPKIDLFADPLAKPKRKKRRRRKQYG